jgi:hypothetical protein
MEEHTMTIRTIWSLALLGMVACNGDKDTGATDTDTDTDITVDTADTGDTVTECTATIEDVYPVTGQGGWYYRDPITVTFNEAVGDSVSYAMTSTDGEVALSVTYDDTGFKATLMPSSGAWSGSSSYNLVVTVCDSPAEYSFATSEYGDALEAPPSSLAGNTYYVDMSVATYTQPPGVGTIIRQFLTNPLLIDITAASDAELTIIGAQGLIDDVTAEVSQDTDYETWDFGSADFATRPYFAAVSNETTFTYGGQDIPVYDFSFDGTFSPDAETIGGMNFSGLGDTRNMGPLLNLGNDPDAACNLIEGVGVECIPCRDGEEYCVMLVGYFEDATLQPDLSVVEVN